MKKIKKFFCIVLGIICLVLGSIGLFFPILPTFPFYLIGAFLFSISSEKLHNYIVSTKFYKENLDLYIKEKKMTKKTKIKLVISLSIIIGIALFFMIKNKLVIPSVILSLVYVFHIIYFGFIVKTK